MRVLEWMKVLAKMKTPHLTRALEWIPHWRSTIGGYKAMLGDTGRCWAMLGDAEPKVLVPAHPPPFQLKWRSLKLTKNPPPGNCHAIPRKLLGSLVSANLPGVEVVKVSGTDQPVKVIFHSFSLETSNRELVRVFGTGQPVMTGSWQGPRRQEGTGLGPKQGQPPRITP